jgi:4,5-dihydroxyphthalate decarboxylase
MTTTTAIEVRLEAQGSQPNFRQDIILPLVSGRVPIEGVTLKPSGPHISPGIFEDPRFKEGDFGLLDTNIGDVIPAINAGWNIVCLPVFTKRKPILNYLWVRSDRGINSPKDLKGKTLSTSGWGVVTTFTRQYLQRFHGVDASQLRWIAGGPGRWELYKQVQVEYPADRKRQERRLLDGEVDGCTGDITDPNSWSELENSPDKVKRLFPNYRELHRQMLKEHGIYTPAHIMAMGGRLNKEHPGLARKLFDALEQSRELAYADALGDGTTYSLIMDGRELVRDQLKEWGDPHKHGIKAQRANIDLLLDAYYEQGQTRRRLSQDEIFAESTLDT